MLPEGLSEQELLDGLTPAQREAVTTVDGPLLVIAAAGSGKTRVLTRRVAYLISQGIPAGSILAITFTNKAAGEMKDRVGKLLGRPLRDFGRLEDRQPTICTFHSLCMRILRRFATDLGLIREGGPSALTIYDTSDQLKVVKEALKLLDLSSTNFPPQAMLSSISNAKNQLMGPDQFRSAASDFYLRQVSRVYDKYQSMLEAQGALDFDDLLLRTVRAFKEKPEVLAALQDKFQYVLIDEYQDTNKAQYVLTHALALRHRNICVVGDPDQSIYAWRGADIQNILDFKKDYPDAAEVRLELNYRSTKTILAIADKLIKNNAQRVDKQLLTDNPAGEKVRLVICQDEHDEADVVVRELKAARERGTMWSGMAVFYRMNSLSRVMEDALRRATIPYVMARGTAFYDRREIKDVLSYLRVLVNVFDEVSLKRMVNTPPRGIGDTSIEKVRAYAIARGMSLFAGLAEADRVEGLSSRAKNAIRQLLEQVRGWQKLGRVGLEPYRPALDPSRVQSAVADDEDAPDEVEPEEEAEEDLFTVARNAGVSRAHLSAAGLLVPEDIPAEPASMPGSPAPSDPAEPGKGLITTVMEAIVRQSGLEQLYAKESRSAGDTGIDPLGNVGELISSAAEFDAANPDGTLEEYLNSVALVSDIDGLRDTDPSRGGAVTMMTLHAAKGLEFPVVAMIGMEEGILPHSRARADVNQLEEERRLAFVGITRAQERLMLTKAAYRTIRGLRERTVTSPFLLELPPEYIEITDRAGPLASASSSPGRVPFDRRYDAVASEHERTALGRKWKQGQLVRHPTFGQGKITELSGTGQQTRCVIDFDKAGRKTLILEYAKLEPV